MNKRLLRIAALAVLAVAAVAGVMALTAPVAEASSANPCVVRCMAIGGGWAACIDECDPVRR